MSPALVGRVVDQRRLDLRGQGGVVHDLAARVLALLDRKVVLDALDTLDRLRDRLRLGLFLLAVDEAVQLDDALVDLDVDLVGIGGLVGDERRLDLADQHLVVGVLAKAALCLVGLRAKRAQEAEGRDRRGDELPFHGLLPHG
jgi:hypothetical protein